eukprot:CAMPEP_0172630564 /NCGR_PEP_ID=MMETSP1068-20121228/174335_1 /TAXON_ID=35684 /ORGANISM="Pseudopedinella elastica, Strain CCMP716" /LENGTH=111 /DNA_ID=CAMNT_0013441439 /DNA_START=305 /DNA_END=641 /DNA_ORIENTATION=+
MNSAADEKGVKLRAIGPGNIVLKGIADMKYPRRKRFLLGTGRSLRSQDGRFKMGASWFPEFDDFPAEPLGVLDEIFPGIWPVAPPDKATSKSQFATTMGSPRSAQAASRPA